MPLSDIEAVQVVLGGKSYQDWLSVDMDSDIFNPADAWSMTAALPPTEIRSLFREGGRCDLYVGPDKQMAGVIDNVEITGDRSQTRLTLSGRDPGAFLVDSEAPAKNVSNYTIQSLVQSMLDPSFGIKSVIFSNDDNRKVLLGKKDKKALKSKASTPLTPKPRPSTKIDPGQKIAAIIDEHTRRLGMAWWLTAGGDLFLGKPSYSQEAAYSFQVADVTSKDAVGNNVESWTVKRAMADRASTVQVNGTGLPSKGKTFDTSKGVPRFKGLSSDPDLVARGIVRKQIIPDYDSLNQSEAQNRADMEQGRRRLEALAINLTVPGFRTPEGRLYAIDTVANVRIDEADINGTYYVTQRRFKEERGSRRTMLTLHEMNVWLP